MFLKDKKIGGDIMTDYVRMAGACVLAFTICFSDLWAQTTNTANPILQPGKTVMDTWMRDPFVCVGPDGNYYLTGTSKDEDFFRKNEGIRIWKSADLKKWEPLGLVWSFAKDMTWQAPVPDPKSGKPRQAIWAPELHYIKGAWYIPYCKNYGGTGILRSKTAKVEGPYEDIKKDGPLTDRIDTSLFVDDDSVVYFIYQDAQIARMKDDMSGLAEKPHPIRSAAGKSVGFEACHIFKKDGRYYLIGATHIKVNGKNTYSSQVMSAGKLAGPWSEPTLAILHGGHGNIFRDRDGQWWSTIFAPWMKFGLVPVEFRADGGIGPMVQGKVNQRSEEGAK